MIQLGDRALLKSEDGREYLVEISHRRFSTQHGFVELGDLVGCPYGAEIKSHLGKRFFVFSPTVEELVRHTKRQTQIIYPKEIGYLVTKLGISSGMTVVECGTGSGGLSTALAWFLRPDGRLITYEARDEFAELAGKNLAKAGLSHLVTIKVRDVGEDGFDEVEEADAVVLDMRTPWDLLPHAFKAMKGGAPLGVLVPTTNQVSETLRALKELPFASIEVCELMLRNWKPVADRLRPDDRMVAHTGFLVFARKVVRGEKRDDEPC